MKKIIKLTEQDIRDLVVESLNEQQTNEGFLKLLHSTATTTPNSMPQGQNNSNTNTSTNVALSQDEKELISETMDNINMADIAQRFKNALLQVAQQCNSQNFNCYVRNVIQSWNNLVNNCVLD